YPHPSAPVAADAPRQSGASLISVAPLQTAIGFSPYPHPSAPVAADAPRQSGASLTKRNAGRKPVRPAERFLQTLESEFQRKLRLYRIAHALAQEAIKVEQPRRHQRVDVVLVVEAVEHLKHRDQRITISEFDWPGSSPVKRKETVIFAQMIAPAVDSIHYPR